MIQDVVLVLTLVLMGALMAVFIVVAKSASTEVVEYAPVQKSAYSIRSKFFWVLLVASLIITMITTVDLPYAATHGDTSVAAIEIDVEGRQWFWALGEHEDIHAGDTVVFNVTASDVNHGIGIYDPSMRMLGQTQAMPGYANSLRLTLTDPGTYKLLCMEYCGLAHHAMISEIEVLGN